MCFPVSTKRLLYAQVHVRQNGDKKMNWILTKKETPPATEKGDWDGKRSELCVCQDIKGNYYIARVYEHDAGIAEWYDGHDFSLLHEIVKWCYLNK
jgi:hypothetical protein